MVLGEFDYAQSRIWGTIDSRDATITDSLLDHILLSNKDILPLSSSGDLIMVGDSIEVLMPYHANTNLAKVKYRDIVGWMNRVYFY